MYRFHTVNMLTCDVKRLDSRCGDQTCDLEVMHSALRTFLCICGVNSSQFRSTGLKLCVYFILVALDFICKIELNVE